MNMHIPTSPVPDAASANGTAAIQRAVDPALPLGRTELAIDLNALRKCDMKGLGDIRNVINCLTEVLTAFTCQPRFGSKGTCRLNAAGEILDDILDLLHAFEEAAVNVAKAAQPMSAREVEYRAWTILGREADFADDLSEFSALAAAAARDKASAEFKERHPGGGQPA